MIKVLYFLHNFYKFPLKLLKICTEMYENSFKNVFAFFQDFILIYINFSDIFPNLSKCCQRCYVHISVKFLQRLPKTVQNLTSCKISQKYQIFLRHYANISVQFFQNFSRISSMLTYNFSSVSSVKSKIFFKLKKIF